MGDITKIFLNSQFFVGFLIVAKIIWALKFEIYFTGTNKIETIEADYEKLDQLKIQLIQQETDWIK